MTAANHHAHEWEKFLAVAGRVNVLAVEVKRLNRLRSIGLPIPFSARQLSSHPTPSTVNLKDLYGICR